MQHVGAHHRHSELGTAWNSSELCLEASCARRIRESQALLVQDRAEQLLFGVPSSPSRQAGRQEGFSMFFPSRVPLLLCLNQTCRCGHHSEAHRGPDCDTWSPMHSLCSTKGVETAVMGRCLPFLLQTTSQKQDLWSHSHSHSQCLLGKGLKTFWLAFLGCWVGSSNVLQTKNKNFMIWYGKVLNKR